MILDNLTLANRYQSLVAGLASGFEFLQRGDLAILEDGRHEIDGERVFAMVARGEGRGPQASLLEFHRRFLDIQCVIEGTDVIGWRSLQDCTQPRTPYDTDRDIGFFEDHPHSWFQLAAGNFAIFFPDDAHAPLAGLGFVHKVIVKVAV